MSTSSKSSSYDSVSENRISNDNSQKDNFHNPIFSIDKMVALGIIRSTILIKPSLSKGVEDGERIYEMQSLWWHDDLRKDLL